MRTLKLTAAGLLFTFTGLLNAQNYLGAHYSTYDAILSGNTNPAMAAASDLKWQVNILGFSANANNNYFAIDGKISDVIQNFDMETSFTQILDGKRKNLHIGTEVFGPTGYFRIKDNSFTIGMKVKAISSLNDFNEDLVYSLYNDFDDILNWIPQFSDERASGGVTGYMQFFAGYARTIKLKEQHKLHVGASMGMISNFFNAQFTADNIDFSKLTSGPDTAISLGTTQFDFYVSNQVDDGYNYKFGINGLGADAGVVYELSKANSDEHFLLTGFSVTDLGFTRYELGKNSRSFVSSGLYVPSTSVVDEDGETINLDDLLDTLGTNTVPTGKRTALLPTTMNLFADVRVVKMFYVNTNLQLNPLSFKRGEGKANMPTDITVTPRFETRIFSAFTPLNWNKYNGFSAGVGIRLGQFTIGSRNIITAFAKQHFTGLDLYMNIGFGKSLHPKNKKGKPADTPASN